MGGFQKASSFPIETIDGARAERLEAQEVLERARVGASFLCRTADCAGRFVGSTVSCGWAMPVTYLSIWLAGAAVAALDAEGETAERLAWSVRALMAVLVVVENEAQSSALGSSSSECATIDEMFRAGGEIMTTMLEGTTSHCFFTSGTTGRPKGCVCSRSALAAYATARNEVDRVDARSRIACCSSHTFDPSIGDAAQAAASGATLCVSIAPIRATPLEAFVGRSRATHATTTPALWSTVFEAPSTLRVVSLGGEKTPASLIDRPRTYELRCVYGVTECCVYQTSVALAAHSSFRLVGAPLRGTVLRIVDVETKRPLPIGETGEVAIGGDQVVGARYLEDGSEDRYVTLDGERFYLTGDAGRLNESMLELGGRLDDQVKVDGKFDRRTVCARSFNGIRLRALRQKPAQLVGFGRVVLAHRRAVGVENANRKLCIRNTLKIDHGRKLGCEARFEAERHVGAHHDVPHERTVRVAAVASPAEAFDQRDQHLVAGGPLLRLADHLPRCWQTAGGVALRLPRTQRFGAKFRCDGQHGGILACEGASIQSVRVGNLLHDRGRCRLRWACLARLYQEHANERNAGPHRIRVTAGSQRRPVPVSCVGGHGPAPVLLTLL